MIILLYAVTLLNFYEFWNWTSEAYRGAYLELLKTKMIYTKYATIGLLSFKVISNRHNTSYRFKLPKSTNKLI